ncbi:MAG: hypothetical protein AAF135_12530 [Bacteroidota bacterium]
MLLTIKDTTFSGKIYQEISLEFPTQTVTVREIVTQRVRAEVEKYNERKDTYFKGLVEPSEAEKTLNGYKLKNRKAIDAEKQVYVALDAFQRNGYFVLINDVQAESLDQEVFLESNTEVSFIKLTPLVGG